MVGKLGLVGAVAVAWVLTFVLMGGDVMPSLTSHSAKATGSAARVAPGMPATTPTASPSGTSTGGPDTSRGSTAAGAGGPTDAPGQAAAAAEQLAKTAPIAGEVLTGRPNPRRTAPPVLTFRMATFNALGSSHTGRGHHHGRQTASGATRTARAGQYVLDNNIDLVGFQEMQSEQRSAFMNVTGGRFGLYPGNQLRSLDGENSIAYRLDTWELVKPDTVPIPYFGGHPRNMPVILLRNKQTGITAYFANFHNPADTAEFGKQGHWRAVATDREVALFSQLKNDGYPVFVTGDMNDRGPWFCAVAPAGDLVAAAATAFGQSGCTIPGYRIDWIAASQGVQFSNYHEDRGGLVAWMTDHPVPITDVTIDAATFPKSVAASPAG